VSIRQAPASRQRGGSAAQSQAESSSGGDQLREIPDLPGSKAVRQAITHESRGESLPSLYPGDGGTCLLAFDADWQPLQELRSFSEELRIALLGSVVKGGAEWLQVNAGDGSSSIPAHDHQYALP